LKGRNAGDKIKWVKKEDELSVICIMVVVKAKGIRVLKGVVYIMKSRGSRKKPWGTPQEVIITFNNLTRKERDDK